MDSLASSRRGQGRSQLWDLLCCPHDHFWPLSDDGDALRCPRCDRLYAVEDGIVSFLSPEQLTDQERSEQSWRDQESTSYDQMFEGYTNAVEVATAVRRVGQPGGPVLDAGCGTGRITEALVQLGQPVVAVDYSRSCLRMLVERCAGSPVVAVQADLRHLPVRSDSMEAATCIQVYPHLRGAEARRQFLLDLNRVLVAGAALSISAYNFNAVFRLWHLLGNEGAREGEHMLGGDYYYRRFSRDELRRELEEVFDVEEVSGVRNIPARSVSALLRRAGAGRSADRFLDYMVARGHRADFALERTPVGSLAGFLWLARAVKRA